MTRTASRSACAPGEEVRFVVDGKDISLCTLLEGVTKGWKEERVVVRHADVDRLVPPTRVYRSFTYYERGARTCLVSLSRYTGSDSSFSARCGRGNDYVFGIYYSRINAVFSMGSRSMVTMKEFTEHGGRASDKKYKLSVEIDRGSGWEPVGTFICEEEKRNGLPFTDGGCILVREDLPIRSACPCADVPRDPLTSPCSPDDPSPKRPASRSLSGSPPKRPAPPVVKTERVTVSGDGSRVCDAGGGSSGGSGHSLQARRDRIARGLGRVLGADGSDSDDDDPRVPSLAGEKVAIDGFAPSTGGLKYGPESDDDTPDVVDLGVQAVQGVAVASTQTLSESEGEVGAGVRARSPRPSFTEVFDAGVQTEPLRLSRDEIRGALKEIAVGDSMVGAAMLLLVERVLQDGAPPP